MGFKLVKYFFILQNVLSKTNIRNYSYLEIAAIMEDTIDKFLEVNQNIIVIPALLVLEPFSKKSLNPTELEVKQEINSSEILIPDWPIDDSNEYNSDQLDCVYSDEICLARDGLAQWPSVEEMQALLTSTSNTRICDCTRDTDDHQMDIINSRLRPNKGLLEETKYKDIYPKLASISEGIIVSYCDTDFSELDFCKDFVKYKFSGPLPDSIYTVSIIDQEINEWYNKVYYAATEVANNTATDVKSIFNKNPKCIHAYKEALCRIAFPPCVKKSVSKPVLARNSISPKLETRPLCQSHCTEIYEHCYGYSHDKAISYCTISKTRNNIIYGIDDVRTESQTDSKNKINRISLSSFIGEPCDAE